MQDDARTDTPAAIVLRGTTHSMPDVNAHEADDGTFGVSDVEATRKTRFCECIDGFDVCISVNKTDPSTRDVDEISDACAYRHTHGSH